ncbi:MAG: hypothetical protein AAGK04_09855, partial [Planctomycetota bacterium]
MCARFLLSLCLMLVPAGLAAAEDHEASTSAAAEFVEHLDEPVVTHHVARIRGVDVPYTATAGTMPIVGDDGEIKARMFFIAYQRTRLSHEAWARQRAEHEARHGTPDGFESNSPDPRTRPVTFSFNGGPGSSSVWLHLGI